jgi:cytoskeleton protein RodZ
MPPSVEAPFPSPFMLHRRNLILVGAALLLLVLLGLWLAWSTTPTVPAPAATETSSSLTVLPQPLQDQAPTDASGVSAVPETAAAPVAAPVAKVHLRMTEKTWVEIRDRAGNMLLSQNLPVGSDMQIEGEPPLSLVLGQTRGVQLTFNGRPVALPTTVDPNSGVARLTLE